MFKNAQELKDFILWCQQAKIKAVKVDQIEVQFHDLAFLDNYEAITEKELEAQANAEASEPIEAQKKDEDDLLFWSSNP